MSYTQLLICMPEKWSLPGGEYRRIIVKDHLKIKRPRMKMTHRVYGKPMMTIRKLLFTLTALVNAQFRRPKKSISPIIHTTFIIHYMIENSFNKFNFARQKYKFPIAFSINHMDLKLIIIPVSL